MLDLNAVKLDLEKVDGGCWWEIRMKDGVLVGDPVDTPTDGKPAVLLVPIGQGYERQLERERAPHLVELRRDDLADAERERLQCLTAGAAAAKKVVRGWQNIQFDGEAVPWSEAAAIAKLSSRQWRNLLDFCVVTACERQAALAREEAQAAGN